MESTIKDAQVKRAAAKYMEKVLGILDEIDNADDLESFETRPTDVIVTTFPKAGTVLMQQMTYQIAVLSGGAPEQDPTGMEYDDITTAVPWIEMRKIREHPESKTRPRVMKTHFSVAEFNNRSCKHIVVIRNPKSFPASFLNFLFYFYNPEATDIPEAVYAKCLTMMANRGLLKIDPKRVDQLPAWHAHLKDCVSPPKENVFVLFYEDIVKEMGSTVRRVARFMDCKISERDIETVVERCDQEYMAHDSKFHGKHSQQVLDMTAHYTCTKPKGFIGFKRFPLDPSIVKCIEKYNYEAFGVREYDEIRRAIREEQLSFHGY